jgi:poly(A) polymerase
MNLRVVPRSDHCLSRQDISQEALQVLYRLNECGHLAYIAGGGVRDLLLKRKPKDFDIVTDAPPPRIRALFRNCRLIGRRFRLAHVIFNNTVVEVATFRAAEGHTESEGPIPKGATAVKTPEGLIVRDNVFGTPEEDAIRRDFTINALFYNIADYAVLDYVNGLEDLRDGLLRSIGDPRIRFVEDPARMIRALRFASSIGFRIENQTWEALGEFSPHITRVSKSRLYEELLKLFLCGQVGRVLKDLTDCGLMNVIFPEFGPWLEQSTPEQGRRKVSSMMDRVDGWIRKGQALPPSLLLALLLGPYHEALAAPAIAEGQLASEAIREASLGHLGRLTSNFQIPRAVALETADILAIQPRLKERRRRDIQRLPFRSGFSEAMVYLDASLQADNQNRDLVRWWLEQVRSSPTPDREPISE